MRAWDEADDMGRFREEKKMEENGKKSSAKLVLIVDCGIGNPVFLTRQAFAALKASGIWIGTEELFQELKGISGEHKKVYLTDREHVCAELEELPGQVAAILAEGVPGGKYSAVMLKKEYANLDPVMVPGISKVSYLSEKTGISCEHAAVLDLDHCDAGILPMVRRNRTVFVFTKGHIELTLRTLLAAGEKDLSVCIVENPGTDSEQIQRNSVEGAASQGYAPGSALIVMREKTAVQRSFGIADEEFLRSEKIPMTKSEVRALIISRLMLTEDDIIYDVGAGTGSVSVECALAAPYGRVYSFEKEEAGLQLIQANAEKFGLTNIVPIPGTAPASFGHLPFPDAAFIGGSSGKMKDLIQILHSRNPDIRLAVTGVTLETVTETMNIMEGLGMNPEVTEIQISVSKKAGQKHMMTARNPIFLIFGMSTGSGGVG